MGRSRHQPLDPRVPNGSTFKVLGLGGVGGIVARYLAIFLASFRSEVRLVLLDGDHFDISNATRMLFSHSGNKPRTCRGGACPSRSLINYPHPCRHATPLSSLPSAIVFSLCSLRLCGGVFFGANAHSNVGRRPPSPVVKYLLAASMKFGVVVFPGSNCDHDTFHVLGMVLGTGFTSAWALLWRGWRLESRLRICWSAIPICVWRWNPRNCVCNAFPCGIAIKACQSCWGKEESRKQQDEAQADRAATVRE